MQTLQNPPKQPIFVGREREISDLSAALRSGGSIAIRGEIGSGRRALLRQIYSRRNQIFRRKQDIVLWIPYQSTKGIIAEIAKGIHQAIGLNVPEHLIAPRHRIKAIRTGIEYRLIHRAFMRETIKNQQEILLTTLHKHFAKSRGAVVLFVEQLELPPIAADLLLALSDAGVQIAASVETTNTRIRIQRLLWRFKVVHDIRPLTSLEVHSWIEQYLEREALEFESPRTRDRFIISAIRMSSGKPAAVEQILLSASCEREITTAYLRQMNAEAAHVYIDMTPLLVAGAATMLALRYISRGANLEEMMILAGIGTSIFWVVLYLARLMSRKR